MAKITQSVLPIQAGGIASEWTTAKIGLGPEVRFGKATVKETRITVVDILGYTGAGDTEAELLDAFPQLTHEDILACLSYVADRERLTRIA